METAGIYWEAVASHKKALSILSISDHMFRHEELTALERQESFDEMCSDSEKNMSAFADQNHAPSLTCVRLEY